MVGMFHRSCDVHGRGGCYILIGTLVGVCLRVYFIIMMNTFLLLCRIWAYVNLQRYNSFVSFVYLNYIYIYIHVYMKSFKLAFLFSV
jgi:hypothetical protein